MGTVKRYTEAGSDGLVPQQPLILHGTHGQNKKVGTGHRFYLLELRSVTQDRPRSRSFWFKTSNGPRVGVVFPPRS